MDWTDYTIAVSAEGPTFNPPPAWPSVLNGLYTFSASSPPNIYDFVKSGGATLRIEDIGSSLNNMAFSEAGGTWEAFSVPSGDIINGTAVAQRGAATQDLTLEGTAPTPPPEPRPQVTRSLIKSKMPAGQRPLLNYTNGILTEFSIGQIEAARDSFAEALYASTSPRFRSKVTIQITKDAEKALREAIRAQIGDVPANQKEKKVFVVAKEGPAFRVKMGINQITINGLRGKPVGVNSWFAVEIRVLPMLDEGLDFEITKPNGIVEITETLGSEKVQIRGRWVWNVKGKLTFGPYTDWKVYTLPAWQGDPD